MAQLELLNAAANVTSQEDLDALRLTLSLFFAERAQNVVNAIARHPQTVYRESYFRFHLLSDVDKDDDKFVGCAITAGADYIVT